MTKSYSDFIKDAFIEPIRSVLIIDDDYPTFDEILNRQVHENLPEKDKPQRAFREKGWLKNPKSVLGVIDHLRQQALLIDIHDGVNIQKTENVKEGGDEELVKHLHQSDLLVLDYQLDGASGDAAKAIKILRTITNKDHFNLVVINTTAKLGEVFSEVLLSLTAKSPNIKAADVTAGKTLIEKAEEDDDSILARLRDSISVAQYLVFREVSEKDLLRLLFKAEEPFANFVQIAKEAGWTGFNLRHVMIYLLHAFEEQSDKALSRSAVPGLQWSGFGSSILWVRSNSAFITFSEKSDKTDIFKSLLDGLNAWNPHPSRLFLTRLRAEIEDHGAVAEDQTMDDSLVLARWYLQLLDKNEASRKHLISETVSRHSERLLHKIRANVERFAGEIISLDLKTGRELTDITAGYFKVDLSDPGVKDKAELEHNAFICSKPPEGWHLNTGHIFTIAGGNEYWICLTPACDMVPDQKEGGQHGEAGDHLPFLAVKLRTFESKGRPKDIHSNRFVFIKESDKTVVLCINDPHKESSIPHLYSLFAANQGVLKDLGFRVSKVKKGAGGALAFDEAEAKIVGQLRYEYALNLLQKLGASMTRVGLDFSGEQLESDVKKE